MVGSVGGVPSPVWGLAGGLIGAAVTLWQTHRTSVSDERKTSGTVGTSDAKVVFDAQQAALVMSEQMRQSLRDQVERCQTDIGGLKKERDALEVQLREQATANQEKLDAYRTRVEVLEEELFDMGERLKRKGDDAKPRPRPAARKREDSDDG